MWHLPGTKVTLWDLPSGVKVSVENSVSPPGPASLWGESGPSLFPATSAQGGKSEVPNCKYGSSTTPVPALDKVRAQCSSEPTLLKGNPLSLQLLLQQQNQIRSSKSPEHFRTLLSYYCLLPKLQNLWKSQLWSNHPVSTDTRILEVWKKTVGLCPPSTVLSSSCVWWGWTEVRGGRYSNWGWGWKGEQLRSCPVVWVLLHSATVRTQPSMKPPFLWWAWPICLQSCHTTSF